MDVIFNLEDDSDHAWTLSSLLKDLLGWGNKPKYLIRMAYQWYSAISKKIRDRVGDEPTPEDLSSSNHYGHILSLSLAIAFRHVGPNHIPLIGYLPHVPHDEWMLDVIFTRGDDDVIADAVYMNMVDGEAAPPGSCTPRLLKLTERGRPLSPRLRRAILHFIQQRGISELEAAEPEFVCLLNNLEVGVGEVGDAGWGWMRLWTYVLLTPMGQGHLSSHYWLWLGNLISVFPQTLLAEDRQTEVMTSLEKAQDLEKLETWMLVVWWSMYGSDWAPIQDMERATLTLFRQRPSAIPKFEDLLETHTQSNFSSLFNKYKDALRQICDQARAEQSPLRSPS